MNEEDVLTFARVASLRVSSSTRAQTAQLAVGEDDADADGAAVERFDDCEVMHPLGEMSSPELTETTEAVCIRRGDELVALFLIDKGRPAQAVEVGEKRLHGVGANNQTTVIRLRANGGIDITSANNGAVNVTAHGTGDVVFNGGSLKLARVTDPVRVGTLSGTAGPYPVVFTFTPADADGAPGSPSVGASATLSGVVSNAGGASRAKG